MRKGWVSAEGVILLVSHILAHRFSHDAYLVKVHVCICSDVADYSTAPLVRVRLSLYHIQNTRKRRGQLTQVQQKQSCFDFVDILHVMSTVGVRCLLHVR